VVSAEDLPSFDNSAMDGYAVRSADLQRATKEVPVALQCRGETAAGQAPASELGAGECWRIFTGAPLPAGADAVVMQEDVTPVAGTADGIEFRESVRPWENIRFKGEDIKRGTPLGNTGSRISFGLIAALGAVGVNEVEVGGRPRVGLLATGDELVEPGRTRRAGQVFESNRVMLESMIQEAGGIPTCYPIVADESQATQRALARAFQECDVVITSGGVSVGEHDHVKAAFESLGGTLEFWRIAMRPGKPFVAGRLDSRIFFGLPGNPVSAAVTFLLLVRPALIRLQGGTALQLPRAKGTLSVAVSNPGSRRHFVRVSVDAKGRVTPVGPQGSHVLSGLAQANGLIDLPPQSDWPVGREVEALLFP